MSADAVTEILGLGVLAPAAIALVTCWLSVSVLPAAVSSRVSVALGFLAGFVAGYILLPEWAELRPSRHWHWLPWISLAAGVTGVLGFCAPRTIKWVLVVATTIVAAWFLVPTWASLSPPRPIWLTGLSAGLLLLIGLSEPLPTRIGGRLALGLLGITAAAVALTIAACISLTYARIAGLAACALAGVWAAVWLRRTDSDLAVRAAVPAIQVAVGGVAFVACIEPDPPQYCLLLLPAATLGVWLGEQRSLRKLAGRKRMAVQLASVLAVLLVAAVVSYARLL
jgi:MFS family permease